jgi:hypothetical protein
VTRPHSSDGLRWHPVCVVEKYDADQVEWVRYHCEGELTGDLLRSMLPGPAGGYARDEGNGVVAGGLANIAYLLTGSGGHALAPGRSVFGVGADGGGFSPGHGHLGNDSNEAEGATWYRPMDHGYPVVAEGAVIAGQATFSETEANFAWAEWCWASGEGEPSAGEKLSRCYPGPSVMINRKAPAEGFGAKEPGVAWVFRTEVHLR